MGAILANFSVLIVLLLVMGKSAHWTVGAAMRLSRRFGFSELFVSLFIVTVIAILPEATIAVISALQGVPSLGLGTLLGSNVADLTFVFGMVALLARRDVRVASSFIKNDYLFLAFLMLPLILGFTGSYSRLDGVILIVASMVFFTVMVRSDGMRQRVAREGGTHFIQSLAVLAGGVLLLALAAQGAVSSATDLAGRLRLNPALIGLLVVALGTTLPELLFSVRAARDERAALALGDILGTVVADASLVLGVVALIHPFSFNPRITILTGSFMLLAGFLSLSFLRSGRMLTKWEGWLLLAFYASFVVIEFVLRDWTPLLTR